MSRRGALVLEGGLVFEGDLLGPTGTETQGYGEVVFNTSMTGYQEILSDPSYFGQMVVMTAPQIGNTGVNLEDQESKRVYCSGLVVHELCGRASNWRSTQELEAYLAEAGVPCLTGVATRSLTLAIREGGARRGVIVPLEDLSSAQRLLATYPPFEGRDMIAEVTSKTPYVVPAKGKKEFTVAALDLGVKTNLLRELALRGCEVHVFPAKTPAEALMSVGGQPPSGIFLSNGPGDPEAAPYAVQTVREVLGKVPLFGVCMGHQILALALGARTFKLKFGHRGGNQPVSVEGTGRVEISSHNHGYAVDPETLPKTCEVTHLNLNDKTLEGFRVPSLKAFSVQFHPEACPGPHDSVGLFNDFVEMMRAWRAGVPKVS